MGLNTGVNTIQIIIRAHTDQESTYHIFKQTLFISAYRTCYSMQHVLMRLLEEWRNNFYHIL